jgi:hypothetical protein
MSVRAVLLHCTAVILTRIAVWLFKRPTLVTAQSINGPRSQRSQYIIKWHGKNESFVSLIYLVSTVDMLYPCSIKFK